jgi:pyridoxal phosphate enzyme (YggS family)
MVQSVAENVQAVRERVARACERVGRSPEEVTVIAVTKTVPVELVKAAAACGITDFGENRVQEAETKISQLSQIGRWHFIGTLQTNKVKKALSLFDCFHSVDRPRLVNALAKEEPGGKTLLIQVNVAGEATKHGVSVEELPELARQMSAKGLRLAGLMTIAPLVDDPEQARPVFRRLRELAARIRDMDLPGIDPKHLSMGMTGDFEVAVEEGADLIRIGSAIFGPRRT